MTEMVLVVFISVHLHQKSEQQRNIYDCVFIKRWEHWENSLYWFHRRIIADNL